MPFVAEVAVVGSSTPNSRQCEWVESEWTVGKRPARDSARAVQSRVPGVVCPWIDRPATEEEIVARPGGVCEVFSGRIA